MKITTVLKTLAGAGVVAISMIGLVTGLSISVDGVYDIIHKTEEITETINEI
jgi:hypothetical protein